MKKLIIVISVFISIGCNKENRCFDRPGETTTVTKEFSTNCSKFTIYDDLNIVLINDSLDLLEITGGDNLVNNVSISQDKNQIAISNSNKCTFLSSNDNIDLTIHYTNLEELELNGFGEVHSVNEIINNILISGQNCYSTIDLIVSNDSTLIKLEGSPQLTVTGNTNYLYAYTVGKGNYFLNDLHTHHCHGHSRGIGDFHLNADQSYIIELRSRGDIYLTDTTGTQTFLVLEGEGSLFIE